MNNDPLLNKMLRLEHLHILYTVGAEERTALLVMRTDPNPTDPAPQPTLIKEVERRKRAELN